jgi:hypothetical protein
MGALTYVVAVIVVYSISMFLIVATYLRRKSAHKTLDGQVHSYIKGLEAARIQAKVCPAISQSICPATHLFVHPLIYLSIHSSVVHPLVPLPLIHPLVHPLVHSLVHPLVDPLVPPPTLPCITSRSFLPPGGQCSAHAPAVAGQLHPLRVGSQ